MPFDAIDGEPVRLFFLIVGPESSAGLHVKILSRIARLVRRDTVRQQLLEAKTADEFYHVLARRRSALSPCRSPAPPAGMSATALRTHRAGALTRAHVGRACGSADGSIAAGIWAAWSSSICATAPGWSSSPATPTGPRRR